MIALVFERFRVDVHDPNLDVVGDAAMDQGLIERLVRVAELHILADEADAHLILRMAQLAHDLFPLAERAELLVGKMELVEQDLIQAFA